MALKRVVNALLAGLGQPPRYESQAGPAAGAPILISAWSGTGTVIV